MESAFKFSRIRQFSSQIHLILAGTFFTRAAYFMVWPYLSILLFRRFGLTATSIGAMLTGASILGAFSGIVAGYISDILGRKKVVIAGSGCSSLGFLLLAQANSPAAYMVAITLCALGTSFLESTGKTIIADKIDDKKLREFAFYGRYFLINMGAAVGPMIGMGIGIAARSSTFLITAFVYCVYCVSLAFVLSDVPLQSSGFAVGNKIGFFAACGELVKDTVFLVLIFSNIIVAFVYATFDSSLVQYLTRASIPNLIFVISSMVVVNASTVVFGQFPVLKLVEKYAPRQRIQIGVFIMFISQIFFAFNSPSFLFGWIFAAFVLSVGELIAFPTYSVEVDRNTPSHLRGTYFGASNLYSLGFAAAPVIGGLFLDHSTGRSLYILMTLLCFFVLVLNKIGVGKPAEVLAKTQEVL